MAARPRRALATIGLLAAFGASVPATSHADFNPFGRKPASKPAKPAQPSKPAAPRSTQSKPATPPSAAESKQSTDALIARYTGIVLSRPGELFPLQRLAELYRERDGSLAALVSEFEKRAEQPGKDQYNVLVALAGIYKQDAQPAQAMTTLERAIALRPNDAAAILTLGHLLADRGDKAAARARFEQALPLIKNDADKEATLRTLMTLALDLDDYEGAKKFHAEIVKRARGSFFARAELGRELLLRNQYEQAETEYRELVKAAAGDNRALAPALRDLGRALAAQKKRKEALEVLHRALRAAGDQSGLRREIFDVVVEVHRAENRLPELITLLEKENPRDFERLALLGSLYEETGQVKKALETYQRALGQKRNDISTRLKVVQLLQVQGELDEAITEYEALIRAAPHNPDFVFQLAEALIQRGDRGRALEHLRRLETRSQGEEETLAALVDFYERVGEPDRARDLLERLAGARATDPRHIVELGDRYFQEGNEKKALEIWRRIEHVVPDRARALQTLGEVYLEHDMPEEALTALRKAVELAPKSKHYKKALALALERSGAAAPTSVRQERYDEALRIWESLLRDEDDQGNMAREARQHIVTLWGLAKQLERRVVPLERRIGVSPPDLEAGRLLAEVYLRLRRYADAERALRKVVAAAPGDVATYGQLERVLVLQRKLDGALAVLEKLVKLDPKRAREYYQRMAQYAAELYRDDDAVKYAARAVELSPEDAEGHKKLGEMYRRRQDNDRAIAEFRKAISKNDRLFSVYFDLAELLMNRGEVDDADKLLRRVMRASPDEELVARAARLSMQVNLGRGTLESLEKELLPVALGNPQKPIYRRLLVEIYDNLAFSLVHETRSSDAAKANQARKALREIGERAVKPLLDALADERDSQQRTAIELLSHIRNKSAGPALFNYAVGNRDAMLRTRAMIAVGSLGDPDLLPKLRELLAGDSGSRADETDTVAVAAAWSVARLENPRARPLLLEMLESDAPSIRALAAIGLGFLGNPRDALPLRDLVRSDESGSLARAAGAHALGEIGDKGSEEALRELAESSDEVARGTALIALARMRSAAAVPAIAAALVAESPSLRDAAAAAALVAATGKYPTADERLPIPDGRVEVGEILGELRPQGYAPDDRAKALVELGPALAKAAAVAVQSSPDGARRVEDALLSGPALGFMPLTRGVAGASDAARERAKAAAESIAAAVVEPFLALARHPSADVRILSVRFLARRPESEAKAAVLAAIDDPVAEVQTAALAALTPAHAPEAVRVVTELLAGNADWPGRVRAAAALGRLGRGTKDPTAVAALSAVATTDSFALVRDAAVQALFLVDAAKARPVLTDIARRDPEPRVRRRAKTLLDEN